MIEIKEGDWVLVDHPYLYDTYVVRRVVSFTKAKFVGEKLETNRLDGPTWVKDNARNRDKIKGVFPGENAAKSASVAIRDLYTKKLAAEREIKVAFQKDCLALLNPQ